MTAGTSWLNGAFSRVAKAGQVAGIKTREKFHLAVSNLTAKVSSILSMFLRRQCLSPEASLSFMSVPEQRNQTKKGK